MGLANNLPSKILVLNAGSSSLKFKVFSTDPFQPTVGGLLDRIGDTTNSRLVAKAHTPHTAHTAGDAGGTTPSPKHQKWDMAAPLGDHVAAMQLLMDFLKTHVSAAFPSQVAAVGHRIVHGLDIREPVLLSPSVLHTIQKASALAPLHNPPGLQGIHAAQEVFRGVPQVAVFDTAFHQTLPPHAYTYGLPYDVARQHHVRRYGFHGTSHQFLVQEAATALGKPTTQVNLITCHLGNGSSMAAVKDGRSVDTSMGMTPLEGLLMGSRSGDVDAGALTYLGERLGLTLQELDHMLNKESGLLGVTGHSDLRTVMAQCGQGDARAQLGLDVWVHHVRKYLGAYLAVLEGKVDAVVFSGGIGENASDARALVLAGMQALGLEVDSNLNADMVGGRRGDIGSPHSRIRILVIPTDEELSIAQQTRDVVARRA